MLKVAIVLDQSLHSGGGYQQSLSTLQLFESHNREKYQFLYITTDAQNIAVLASLGIEAHFLDMSMHQDIMQNQQKYVTRAYRSRKYRFAYKKYRKFLTKEGLFIDSLFDQLCYRLEIDIAYFLSPTYLAQMSKRHNYMVCVWDLCHRDLPEFPEVSQGFIFESRELMYHNILPKAFRVIADSEAGKKNMVNIYRLQADRVLVAPFFPAREVLVSDKWYQNNKKDIRQMFNIQGEFIFYPAQFWPHKNHMYILEAIKTMREKKGIDIAVVFTGSDKGNVEYLKSMAKKMAIDDLITFAGFVDTETIISLYKQTLALVMPSHFGPTNLPPLEAFALKCPVLYSDIESMQEQVRGATMPLDLKKSDTLVAALQKLSKSKTLRAKLIQSGTKKVQQYSEEKYWQKIDNALQEYLSAIKTWKDVD